MALFLRGKYTGLYKAGSSECVRDTWRFYHSGASVSAFVTRRDAESLIGRFWRTQSFRMSLHPLDDQQPGLGGRVTAKVSTMDFRTMTPSF